jgi:predicted dehydrogenase
MATPEHPPLKIGVVGTGAMGRNHVRVLSTLPQVELVGIYDPRREAAEAVAQEFGQLAFSDLDDLAGSIDATVVAVPTVAHAEIGCRLLERGVHVLMEKPLAGSLAEADRLLEAADRGGRVLAVGHVEYFNPAVQALLGRVAEAAPPRFMEVQRLGVFSPRSLDVDVVLDLMIHDLQILHALDPSPVAEVRATGIPVLSHRVDIANARVQLASGGVANLTASRVSSDRQRKLRAFLPSRYYSLDYQGQEIKGYRLEEADGQRRIVPDDVPVERAEPLRRELEAFAAACRGEDAPRVDGAAGRQALATALAILGAIGPDALAVPAGA